MLSARREFADETGAKEIARQEAASRQEASSERTNSQITAETCAKGPATEGTASKRASRERAHSRCRSGERSTSLRRISCSLRLGGRVSCPIVHRAPRPQSVGR